MWCCVGVRGLARVTGLSGEQDQGGQASCRQLAGHTLSGVKQLLQARQLYQLQLCLRLVLAA